MQFGKIIEKLFGILFRSTGSFVIAFLICGCFGSNILSQTGNYKVSGRVVDNRGLPLPDTSVRLAWIRRNVGGDLLDHVDYTDAEGRFVLNRTVRFGAKQYLYIDDIVPGSQNKSFPINAPFLSLNSVNPAFRGYPVKFGTEKNIDLGDVKVNFWYGDVSIRLSVAGRKLTRGEWESLWYTIKDSHGRFAAGSGIAPISNTDKEVDLQNSQLLFCIPEGVWTIEFRKFSYSTLKFSGGTIVRSRRFTIKGGKKPEIIDIKIHQLGSN